MRLSTKGRYAVMAMADLAVSSKGEPVALADIAARQEISLSYMEQLFAKLRRSHLVKSVRGPGGGYLLARAVADTKISDIIRAVDEPMLVMRCKAGSPQGCMVDKSRCVTHDLWEELENHIHLFLSSLSLEDVIQRRVLGASGEIHRNAQLGSSLPVAVRR